MSNSDKIVIKVPARFTDKFGQPIYEMLGCYAQAYAEGINEVEINFSSARYVPAFYLSGVAALNRHLNKNGVLCSIVGMDGNDAVGSYLKTIDFPDGFMEGQVYSPTHEIILQDYANKTYMPMVWFSTGAKREDAKLRERLLETLSGILKTQLGLSGALFQAINYFIDELTQNVLDHSCADEGFIFAQFSKTKGYLDINILDNGNGLLKSYINSKKFNPSGDIEAMNFAVYGKSTKDIPESRGFGISTTRNMLVNGLGGKFMMFSGSAAFLQSSEVETIIATLWEGNVVNFPGCYCALRIPLLVENFEYLDFYKYVEQ